MPLLFDIREVTFHKPLLFEIKSYYVLNYAILQFFLIFNTCSMNLLIFYPINFLFSSSIYVNYRQKNQSSNLLVLYSVFQTGSLIILIFQVWNIFFILNILVYLSQFEILIQSLFNLHINGFFLLLLPIRPLSKTILSLNLRSFVFNQL